MGKGKGGYTRKGMKGDYKGKGKTTTGQGPAEGCWTCGGAHYASDFPQIGYKGQKGNPGIRNLCTLSVGRDAALAEETDNEEEE